MKKRIIGLLAFPVLLSGSSCQRSEGQVPVTEQIPAYPQRIARAILADGFYRAAMDTNDFKAAAPYQAERVAVALGSGPFTAETVPQEKLADMLKLLRDEAVADPQQFRQLADLLLPTWKAIQIDSSLNKAASGVEARLSPGYDRLTLRIDIGRAQAMHTPLLKTFAFQAMQALSQRSFGYCLHVAGPQPMTDPVCGQRQFNSNIVLVVALRQALKL